MEIPLQIVVWLEVICKEDIRSYGHVEVTRFSNLLLGIDSRWQMMELMMEADQQVG